MNPQRNEIEDHLTAREVAARLSICTKTIRRMVDRGVLRPVRLSTRCVRYSVADVSEALSRMSGGDKQHAGVRS